MKKVLSFLLSICLICVMIPNAHAAGSIHIDVSASATSVGRGDTVTFTVTVSGSGAVTQYGLQLSYDSSVFEMVDGAHSVSGAQFAEFNPARGLAVLYGSATVPSGTVGTFTLRVKDDAAYGSYSVSGNAAAKNGAETVEAGASGASVTVACKHSFGAWTKVDDKNHKHVCSACGQEETVGHSWDGGQTITAANCISDGEVKYTCTGCGLTRNEKVAKTGVHAYDHSCDVNCNVCNATRTANHNFSGEWKNDTTSHWRECTNCGVKETPVAHQAGPEPTDNDPQVCTVCNYMIKPSLRCEHVYANKLTGDEKGHGYKCNKCDDVKDFAAHEFDNDCDKTCNACQYERTIEHKWQRGVCEVCGAKEEGYVSYTMPIIIGAVIVAGIAAAVIVIVKKKKATAA